METKQRLIKDLNASIKEEEKTLDELAAYFETAHVVPFAFVQWRRSIVRKIEYLKLLQLEVLSPAEFYELTPIE